MVKVEIGWNWIEWNNGDTWAKNVFPRLCELGMSEEMLERCVYIIRVNGIFAVDYPKGVSSTIYVGQGNFKNRMTQHKNWLSGLSQLVKEFSFKIGVCIPRVRNSYYAYQDLEAVVIQEFKDIYGCAPLKNGKLESSFCDYEYVPQGVIRRAIMGGHGKRPSWAIRPTRHNEFYDRYYKTYVDDEG